MPAVSAPVAFARGLGSRRPPDPVVRPLAHRVDPAAPSGGVRGLARSADRSPGRAARSLAPHEPRTRLASRPVPAVHRSERAEDEAVEPELLTVPDPVLGEQPSVLETIDSPGSEPSLIGDAPALPADDDGPPVTLPVLRSVARPAPLPATPVPPVRRVTEPAPPAVLSAGDDSHRALSHTEPQPGVLGAGDDSPRAVPHTEPTAARSPAAPAEVPTVGRRAGLGAPVQRSAMGRRGRIQEVARSAAPTPRAVGPEELEETAEDDAAAVDGVPVARSVAPAAPAEGSVAEAPGPGPDEPAAGSEAEPDLPATAQAVSDERRLPRVPVPPVVQRAVAPPSPAPPERTVSRRSHVLRSVTAPTSAAVPAGSDVQAPSGSPSLAGAPTPGAALAGAPTPGPSVSGPSVAGPSVSGASTPVLTPPVRPAVPVRSAPASIARAFAGAAAPGTPRSGPSRRPSSASPPGGGGVAAPAHAAAFPPVAREAAAAGPALEPASEPVPAPAPAGSAIDPVLRAALSPAGQPFTVQREDVSAPAPTTAPAPGVEPPAGTPQPTPGDSPPVVLTPLLFEEIYERVEERLRGDLLFDRERKGLLADAS
jgi:hypothetical protein